jgi:S1-C subfamily serine protease
MIPPKGRLKAKKRDFHEIVYDMRHVVCSVIRQRPMQGAFGASALGTGFFAARNIFITCDHVMNSPPDPHQPGDTYVLASNLTGNTGKIYNIPNAQIGTDIHLFPNMDLAVLRVPNTEHDQPFVALEYGDVYEGQDVGVVGYPLPELNVVNGNLLLDGLVYRAARGHVTGRFYNNDGALTNVPYIEVNFMFVPGNSGGPVFDAETGRVLGFVRGFRWYLVHEGIATVTRIQQMPLGVPNQYVERLNAIYSIAVKLDFIRATIENFGVTL